MTFFRAGCSKVVSWAQQREAIRIAAEAGVRARTSAPPPPLRDAQPPQRRADESRPVLLPTDRPPPAEAVEEAEGHEAHLVAGEGPGVPGMGGKAHLHSSLQVGDSAAGLACLLSLLGASCQVLLLLNELLLLPAATAAHASRERARRYYTLTKIKHAQNHAEKPTPKTRAKRTNCRFRV